ncbi:hypothetical protein [Burkholderia pseudomultivorans]|uniref:hypothetical protein n=1 Tax=Burkholderia pseudomultivorans TaxID=1207504 RepID=UPI000ACCE39B|nr:hypothetical protein [Burkholderia pseudomultivorans]
MANARAQRVEWRIVPVVARFDAIYPGVDEVERRLQPAAQRACEAVRSAAVFNPALSLPLHSRQWLIP